MLLEHHRNVEPLDSSSLRLCVSAGEALPAQLGEDWQRTLGVEVLDGIGSTEMLHMFMSNHEGEARYGSSGRLLSGYDAIVDWPGASFWRELSAAFPDAITLLSTRSDAAPRSSVQRSTVGRAEASSETGAGVPTCWAI